MAWYFGAVIGPLAISGALYLEFPPEHIFLVFAFIYVIFIAAFYKICPNRKSLDDNLSQNGNITGSKSSLWTLKDPAVIIGSMILFFFEGSLAGLSTWLTTYFLNFSIKIAYGSVILSLYWLFSIIGMLITTKIITKYKEVNILFYSCLIGIICLSVFSFTTFIYIKIAALALQAIFFAAIFPITTAISANRDPKNSGTILGFAIAIAFAGSIVFQPLYGYAAEYFGKEYIAYITLIGALIGFVFVSMLFVIIKKSTSESP
jgi:fucose permease